MVSTDESGITESAIAQRPGKTMRVPRSFCGRVGEKYIDTAPKN